MKQLSLSLITAGFIGVPFFGSSAAAQTSDDRLALKGYDPVAYFTDRRPIVGNPQYQLRVGRRCLPVCVGRASRHVQGRPDRYLPQYNNWCAASVAKGEKVYGNPEWWLVVDGRLYLFGKPIGPD